MKAHIRTLEKRIHELKTLYETGEPGKDIVGMDLLYGEIKGLEWALGAAMSQK